MNHFINLEIRQFLALGFMATAIYNYKMYLKDFIQIGNHAFRSESRLKKFKFYTILTFASMISYIINFPNLHYGLTLGIYNFNE